MSQYFDKDFLKFFLGFVSIVLLSLVIIIIAQSYKSKSEIETVNIAQPVVKTPQ